jgi:regulator of protease activity HflC (stomatin/prohibitin superfamily)
MFFKFIPTNKTGILQTFNKFSGILKPGLNLQIPFIQKIDIVSNKVCENTCELTVRTHDKVFPVLDIAIQYQIKHENSKKAFYHFDNPLNQMITFTDNIVRKEASMLSLDELYESHTHLSDAINEYVGEKMFDGGIDIISSQVRNIVPPEEVLNAMNRINAAERKKLAAEYEGNAEKIKLILKAEADAEEKYLRGKGIANMRTEITKGWAESVKKMCTDTNINPEQALKFQLSILNQETMENMAHNNNSKIIFNNSNNDVNNLISGIESSK